VVTGAARGIGAAAARLLADSGWRLVLFDRCADLPGLSYPLARPEDLAETVEVCGGAGTAEAVIGDSRDPAALDEAVRAAVHRFGRLDAAVGAAGCIAGGAPVWEASDETWTTMVSVNLEGIWRLARAAAPALLSAPPPRRGRFVAVASAGGLVGLPLLAAYSAAKAGVIGLVRALAAELGPHGVTANCVAPGSTGTAMLDASAAVYGLTDVSEFSVHHLLGRILTPEEPAALVAWLCGEAAGGVTGAVLPVDAGMTAH